MCGCGSVSSALPSATRYGTLTGIVRSAPSCPVERVDHPCPARPVDGALVQALKGGRVAAQQRTTENGGFTFRLQAGEYVVRATSGRGYASTTEKPATLITDHTRRLILVLDSGIR